jgi:hypothetical protein
MPVEIWISPDLEELYSFSSQNLVILPVKRDAVWEGDNRCEESG